MIARKYFLCIDDDEDDCSLLNEALQKFDTNVKLHFAKSGDDAVLILRDNLRNHNLPELITLDINMPGLNGWDTLIEIQTILGDKFVPIVFLTTTP